MSTLSAIMSPLPVITQAVWARQYLHLETGQDNGNLYTNKQKFNLNWDPLCNDMDLSHTSALKGA